MNGYKYIIIVLFACMFQYEASQYWVRPNITVDCPMGVPTQRCVTLSDIAANNSKYFTSNIEIWFLAGVYVVTERYSGGAISVSEYWHTLYNISLIGERDSNGRLEPSTVIKCQSHNFGFIFNNVHNLSLSNIAIIECGFSHNLDVVHIPFSTIHTSLFLESIENLQLEDVLITKSIGFGLFGLALKGDMRIDSCIFSHNNNIPYSNLNGTQVKVPGGNAYLQIYRYLSPWPSFYQHTSLTISNSFFVNGLSCYKNRVQDEGYFSAKGAHWSAGLYVYTKDTLSSNCIVSINNCTFYNNTAIQGANILVTWHTRGITDPEFFLHYTLIINNCTIDNGKSFNTGGGVYVELIDDSGRQRISVDFIFTNSIYSHNTARGRGGALAINSMPLFTYLTITIQGNKFIENSANSGAAIFTKVEVGSISHPYEIIVIDNDFFFNNASESGGAIFSMNTDRRKTRNYHIEKCFFKGNSASIGTALSANQIRQEDKQRIKVSNSVFTEHHGTAGYDSNKCSVIHLHGTDTFYIENTSFIDNSCRGIHVNMSTIKVGKDVWIVNNTATQGAGILLDCYPFSKNENMSRMIFTNATSLYIQSNYAHGYGGGIAVSGCSNSVLCFFKSNSKSIVYMSDNKAGIAGTSIYGGYLEHCRIDMKTQLTPDVFWKTFNITDKSMPSVVTSRSYKVCICSQKFITDHTCLFEHSIEVYPGGVFHIPAVGVGQYNYSYPSVIRATVVNGHYAEIGERQITQVVNLLCKNLTYSLQTQEKIVAIQLSIETPLDTVLPTLQPATLTVTILDCPIGFELYKESQKCNCLPHLAKEGVTCNILDQTVHRSRTMWIGNLSGDIVVHKNCPYDYCDQNVTYFNLDNQQDQCDLNRTGILCGACQIGYSLVLGTSQCKECSNIYLLLLIPFFLAGFCLVVLLLKCNLTVSMGTINGLIFYANIIQVNNKVFSPIGNFSAPIDYCTYILSIFIAWINLDLGIEVCFCENLNAFTRTWLQFLFPIYIWLLVGLLILVCRYSTTVSRLTGSNTVPVLATLFLLSYAKLLRTTLSAFSPITIMTDRSNTTHLRWLLDGNYGFLHWPHLTLFLVGLLTLVTHLVPFTALVLLGPTLQAHTDYRVLGWVIRFKPFLDAYQGPYKTNYRYWTGLMLLVRVFLFAIFAGNSLGDPNVNLLSISLTLVILMTCVKIGRVYKLSPLSRLELFYLINLLITTIATLYLRATGETNTKQQILFLIMVGSVLLVFIGTLIYHGYSELIRTNFGKKLKTKVRAINNTQSQPRTNNEEVKGHNEEMNQSQEKTSPTRTVVSLEELKEPLLD